MEEIYYLVHTTNNPDCINWSELKTSKFNTDDQFPGVYLSIITKDNINNEHIYPGGKYILIFSKKLLLQNNYHINITDYNGIISEKNTYFPWNLDKFISNSKNSPTPSNEVVFHDNIPMKYCCNIIGIFLNNSNIKKNNFLPKISIENEETPDMSKNPFYCYPFEDIYTGNNVLPRSSNKWYEMISKVCKVNTDKVNDTPENIIKKIRYNAYELYNKRDEQNINLLKEYTNSRIGGKNTKRKYKNKSKKNNQKTLRKNKLL